MSTEFKDYKVNNTWGIRCITYSDYFGNKSYEVQQVMINVFWFDIVKTSGILYDKDSANSYFKNLIKEIKGYSNPLIS